MIEKPAIGRANIKHDFNSLSIEIPSKKNWFVIIFMLAWMGGWAVGEFSVIGILLRSDAPIFANAFLLFWLVGWTLGGIFAIYSVLWMLIGSEIITVDRGILEIKKSIKGIGRKRSYEIKSIRNLDINPMQDMGIWGGSYSRNTFGMKRGRIKFDYGMKTIKFANGIDEAEARMILNKLKSNTSFRDENFADKRHIV